MLNSTPRTPNFVRFQGQLETYGGASNFILHLLETGQNGIVVLPKIELHLENGTFTFVAHPHLQGRNAILDILERQRGQFTFLGLPVCHMFSLHASSLILESLTTIPPPESPLRAVVHLPSWSVALTYAKQIAPLERWKTYPEGLVLAQPYLILRIIESLAV